jgi:hypothetical protein
VLSLLIQNEKYVDYMAAAILSTYIEVLAQMPIGHYYSQELASKVFCHRKSTKKLVDYEKLQQNPQAQFT